MPQDEIEVIGENFIRDFCPKMLEHPEPLDIDSFLEVYLGLKLDFQYLSHNGVYLGMMVFNDTDKVVIYDPDNNRAEYLHADARTVIIDNSLLEENQEHRYRYTLGHEAGHDIFHSGYYGYNPNQISFFDRSEQLPMVQCRAANFSYNARGEWTPEGTMERQANAFSAVLLMPETALKKVVERTLFKIKQPLMRPYGLIGAVSKTFNVSPEAAKIRLEKKKYIEPGIGDVGLLNSNLIFSALTDRH